MKKTVAEIAAFVGGEVQGNPGLELQSLANLKNAGPADLAFADEKFYAEVPASRAGCILLERNPFPDRTVIVVRAPKLAMARAATLFVEPDTSGPAIHPTAVIEPGAVIGRGTRVGAGCYIGRGVRIGNDTQLYPRVVVYAGAEIGNRVTVHAGAVIGADGFGFVWDGERYVKFPQLGGVIIEDDVEIGANTCIDRGSLGATIIRRGAKLDNLVQIGHNVEVGEHAVIAAQTGVAGSSIIGARSLIGGQVGIADHVTVDAGSILGAQAGVPSGKHIRGGGLLWGTPARPIKELLAQQAALARLPRFLKELRKKTPSSSENEKGS
ncbi:MAG TPA: UDP-3-O-(3-hydroxymyristoyl)glucosamine N-acyltransferase [Terriglobia bacterium]|nr:UDP-3-O-(3-hydroxymyristoyl)glucosamine N-acyltransferase [Terriglobia bacterium]